MPRRGLAMAVPLAIISILLLSLGGLVRPADAAPVDAGFKDHSYGTGVGAPTEDKPQSKVWFTDGSWWAGMFVAATGDYRIHRYNAGSHTWTSTGVPIDARNSSHGDYLWDGATNSLYVASVNGDSDADPILVFKLNYNPSTDTYTHDPDFGAGGVTVGTGPSESVTIAKDSTGQLWVTFTNPVDPTGVSTTDRNVMVNRSLASEHLWGAPFALSDGRTSGDDISAIIAFGGNAVGVMWSDQNPSETQTFFYFATHSDAAGDTTWSTKQASAQGTDEFAEDHINLKLVATNSGEVLAAVKANGGPDHILVLRRNAGTGNWTTHVVVGGAQDVSRPQIVVDSTNSLAYVLFTTPERSDSGVQKIYYKSAPLSTLSFGGGLGTPFIADGTVDINDVSTAKHSVTSATGLMAIASSDTNNSYYHGFLSLGGSSSGHPFTDIAGSTFEDDIVWLWQEGITGGCTPTTFCPNNAVTRGQMAAFLDRALDLDNASEDYFTDDNGSTFEDSINAVREAGIAFGCTATTFCPNATVTRGQMAAFLDRALDLADGTQNYFTDDNGSTFEDSINAVREAEIAFGCTATRYCPTNPVTRGQMAAFLHRALG